MLVWGIEKKKGHFKIKSWDSNGNAFYTKTVKSCVKKKLKIAFNGHHRKNGPGKTSNKGFTCQKDGKIQLPQVKEVRENLEKCGISEEYV